MTEKQQGTGYVVGAIPGMNFETPPNPETTITVTSVSAGGAVTSIKVLPKLTLAEVKRRLQPGVIVSLIWHRQVADWKDLGVRDAIQSPEGYRRKVGKVQTNAITLIGEREGRPINSWLYWPKASDFQGVGNEFTIMKDGQPFMKYRIED